MASKITIRAALYLESLGDEWSLPRHVADRLGDTPSPTVSVVKSVLGRMAGRGLVQIRRLPGSTAWQYAITEAGRAALAMERRE